MSQVTPIGKKAERRLAREASAKERDMAEGRRATDDALVAHFRDVRAHLPDDYRVLRENAEKDAAAGIEAAADALVLMDRAESPRLHLVASLP